MKFGRYQEIIVSILILLDNVKEQPVLAIFLPFNKLYPALLLLNYKYLSIFPPLFQYYLLLSENISSISYLFVIGKCINVVFFNISAPGNMSFYFIQRFLYVQVIHLFLLFVAFGNILLSIISTISEVILRIFCLSFSVISTLIILLLLLM